MTLASANLVFDFLKLFLSFLSVIIGFIIACYTLRKQKEFELKKEHTEDLREVIKKWINELEENVKVSVDLLVEKLVPIPEDIAVKRYALYTGKDLEIENNTLFDDLIFKHIDPSIEKLMIRKYGKKEAIFLSQEKIIFYEVYSDFKRKCEELLEIGKNLRDNLENYLERQLWKRGFKLLCWHENYNNPNLEPGFFERCYTLHFFLYYLLQSKCSTVIHNHPLGIKFGIKDCGYRHDILGNLHCVTFAYNSARGEYIDIRIDQNIIYTDLLKDCCQKFYNEVSKISELITIGIHKRYTQIVQTLKEIEKMPLIEGECPYLSR